MATFTKDFIIFPKVFMITSVQQLIIFGHKYTILKTGSAWSYSISSQKWKMMPQKVFQIVLQLYLDLQIWDLYAHWGFVSTSELKWLCCESCSHFKQLWLTKLSSKWNIPFGSPVLVDISGVTGLDGIRCRHHNPVLAGCSFSIGFICLR